MARVGGIFSFCGVLALLALAGEVVRSQQIGGGAGGFVRVVGTQFVLGGSPFLFNGFNSYWMMHAAAEPSERLKVSDVFREAATAGLSVCRTWAFSDGGDRALQLSPGVYDERMFQGLDFVVSEARRHGIRLILSLVNNFNDFGGRQQYVQWASNAGVSIMSSDDFYTNAVVKGYYKNHVKLGPGGLANPTTRELTVLRVIKSLGLADLELGPLMSTGGNHDHLNSAEVTAPNPVGISVTPSEIGGSSSSHCLPAKPTRRALQVRSGGREQLRTSAKRASKGFIGLVVSAPSGEKRLNGHLGWSRAMAPPNIDNEIALGTFITIAKAAEAGHQRQGGQPRDRSRRDRLGRPETELPKAQSLRHAYIIARPRSLRHSELPKVRSLRHAYIIARPRSLRHSELPKARSLRHTYITARPRSLRPSELPKAQSLRHAYITARPMSLRHSELPKARSLWHVS
ncbi:hypothetical protein Taro_016564 [Colocasia esculenta]|uniref:mannan endo-1,4-beta-mannosidase n=1 Tax=Colocasia esculenta TaxID=4460 RepID=A0A843UT94_COLES|nr:hypothetical protein [Colocasia esculenta]